MTLQPPQPSRHRTTDSEERNYQQIRVRQDTNTNWLKNNPIPASGEWCYSIGYRNPPTTYPLTDLPPATKELEGTFILVSDGDDNYVYECVAGLGGNGYLWRPRDIIYVEPQQPDQCVKIGDGNVRWSELPWLGGRGPQGIVGPEGPQGEKGWGVVYRTVETVSAEGQTIFRLMTTVEVETSMVTINGVILSPSNYTLTSDTLTLTNSIDTKAGDIVAVFSWIGAVESIIAGLNTADIETLSVRPSGVEAKPRSEIKNQQEVNWYLLDKVDDLEIPEAIDKDLLASKEWVENEITIVKDDQKGVDEEQDREIEQIESRVSQIESVSLDAKYLYEADAQVPRDGEFTCLKSNGTEIADQWSETQMLLFAENALEGKPDWGHVTANDVIRIGGSSAGIILPTQSREADTFAEFKVVSLPGERLFEVELIRGSSQPMAGVEYGVLLLSSFDPSGLATTIWTTEELSKKYDKSGGEITGNVNVTGGTLKITKNELKIEREDGSNAFRVQPETQVTFNVPARMNEPLDMKDNKITGCGRPNPASGQDVVTVDFLNEALGTIDTNVGDAVLSDNQTFTGINTFTKEIRSESNTVMEFKGDPSNPQDRHFKVRRGIVMTIYCYSGQDNNSPKKCFHAKWDRDQSNPEVYLNYIANPTNNGHPVNLRYADANYLKLTDADGAYVSKEGDEINSYLKVHSTSSGTSSVPFGVYTAGNTASPKFHVTGSGSVRAGNTASDAFMAYYDHDLVTLKKLKEELEKIRSESLPLLWKYNPDVTANNLSQGEFNLGSNPDWDGDGSNYLYMAKLNPKGKKWFGKKGDGSYSHDLGWWGMLTIYDYDPDLVLQAKAGKVYFNEGTNNYFKIHISYLKKNFGLNAGRYYNINLPGFLPQWKYTNSMYTDGNTFSAFDLPDEEKKE